MEELIRCLDYEQNDIFIHFDIKSAVSLSEYKDCVKKSRIYLFQEIDVQWGAESQVDVELFLFQKAYYNEENYRYYHLMLGQDLPIRPVENIYHYFDHKNVEFLEFGTGDHDIYRMRLGNYHYRGRNEILRKLFGLVNRWNWVMGRDRLTRYNLKVYKGSNWASLTNKAVA